LQNAINNSSSPDLTTMQQQTRLEKADLTASRRVINHQLALLNQSTKKKYPAPPKGNIEIL